MRNVIVLGSGRSGTSMVAGTLARAGYFMGDHLLPAREANAKGFFEDVEVNGVNEALLDQVVPQRPRFLGKWFFRDRPLERQRWLARVPVGTRIPSVPEVIDRIRKLTRREPFCFKDPRFSYTLGAWRPLLERTSFVCVFRDPASTAMSILTECREDVALHTLSMNFHQALAVWTLMYRHIVEVHSKDGDWLFLHYNQVLQLVDMRDNRASQARDEIQYATVGDSVGVNKSNIVSNKLFHKTSATGSLHDSANEGTRAYLPAQASERRHTPVHNVAWS